jgi:hypothetical protein
MIDATVASSTTARSRHGTSARSRVFVSTSTTEVTEATEATEKLPTLVVVIGEPRQDPAGVSGLHP